MFPLSVRRFRTAVLALAFVAGPVGAQQSILAAAEGGRAPALDTALEALARLKGMDVEANPALKAAVLRVLESTRGTARFVEIVRDFALTGQETGLLEVARRIPGESGGADAMRLLLRGEGSNSVTAALTGPSATPADQQSLARALANTADPAAVPLLSGLVLHRSSEASVVAEAVRGLARTEQGARRLLELGRAGQVPEAARQSAALALAQARWPALRESAATVFPLPRMADGGELPPLSELVRAPGHAERGAQVFRSEKAACIRCHRVGAEGVDFGPALTEIGTKLARQALYESILDPSSGIAFGYEAWSFELKNGDEVFGILASETATELAVRQPTGVVVAVRASDIARRERQKVSVMPAGLAALLTRQELVDLVEYLTSLKAAGGPAIAPR